MEYFLLEKHAGHAVHPCPYRYGPASFPLRQIAGRMDIRLQPFLLPKGCPVKRCGYQIWRIRFFHPVVSRLRISVIIQGRGTVQIGIRFIELPGEGAAVMKSAAAVAFHRIFQSFILHILAALPDFLDFRKPPEGFLYQGFIIPPGPPVEINRIVLYARKDVRSRRCASQSVTDAKAFSDNFTIRQTLF